MHARYGACPVTSSVFVRRAPWIGAFVGAAIGAGFAIWTLAARKPDKGMIRTNAMPSQQVQCPAGYSRSQGFDSTAMAEGTRTRWLIRCETQQSKGVLGDVLEALWLDEIPADPRVRNDQLDAFVRAFNQRGPFLMENPRVAQDETIANTSAASVDVDGAFKPPAMSVNTWFLPAGASTIQVTVSGPNASVTPLRSTLEAHIQTMQGLTAFDLAAAQPAPRGFAVTLACPTGFNDATPSNGGPTPSSFMGRYCLKPDELGGIEFSVAQLPARVDTPAAVAKALELTSAMVQAQGIPTGNGFGKPEEVTVHGFKGMRAQLEIEPPAARIRVHGLMIPSGSATIFALSTGLVAQADARAAALAQWASSQLPAAPYDREPIRVRANARRTEMIALPTIATALLGALAGMLWRRSKERTGVDED